jgi:DNA-binding beta-propeller fold protein YncE
MRRICLSCASLGRSGLRFRVRFLMISALLAGIALPVLSFVPYYTYTYNRWREPVPSPHAFLPQREIRGEDLGIGRMDSPGGMFVWQDREVFIADTGNNRVVRLASDWTILDVYETFDNNGVEDSLLAPSDVFVTDEGRIYIADTENSRIVELELDGAFVRVIGEPESDLIDPDFLYRPKALVLDRALRIYVVAQWVNEGLMELDSAGNFRGFVGANRVNVNLAELFWKAISTQEQRSTMRRFVPTDYNNVTIDSEGFLFATTSALAENDILSAILYGIGVKQVAPIRRLNPKGDDILQRYDWYPPVGDVRFSATESSIQGPSTIVDVAVDDSGIYYALDSRRGRVFVYDPDGILLYAFGGVGNRFGLLQTPKAIGSLDGQVLVLDADNAAMTVFEPTEYGTLIDQAISSYYSGNYMDSLADWEAALAHNANLEWAYWGIGNAYYRQDEFREAMDYFAIIRYGGSYSRAYKHYRKEFLQAHFGWFIAGAVVLIGGLRFWSRRRRRRREAERRHAPIREAS